MLQLELRVLGFRTSFVPMDISSPDGQWDGVRRRYYQADTYYLPHCEFIGAEAARAEAVAEAEAEAAAAAAAATRIDVCRLRTMLRTRLADQYTSTYTGVCAYGCIRIADTLPRSITFCYPYCTPLCFVLLEV